MQSLSNLSSSCTSSQLNAFGLNETMYSCQISVPVVAAIDFIYKSVRRVSCAASTSALCYRDLKSACVKTKAWEKVWPLYWKWMFCVCPSHECILWLFQAKQAFLWVGGIAKKSLLTIFRNLLATTTPLPPFVKIICSQVRIHFWIWCKNYAVFYKTKRNNRCISINGVISVKLKHILAEVWCLLTCN